jgi:conjugative relaxase-like TrwC/TraI family protein
MLRITQQVSSQGAKRYYATADYYTEGQEIVGAWGGRAAERLGLKGEVDRASFDRLCDNLDPRDGKQLTVLTLKNRSVGYDFTFSVPKSVSLLYAMTEDKEVLSAFRQAVDETMRDIESEMKTRVRRFNRDNDRDTGNMVWAEFIHTTSRPVDGVPDPQLHAHCFAFNTTWDPEEQRWKAGQFRDLKRDAPYYQAAFRVRLADKLQDLGFGIERKRDDFEIAGIPNTAIKQFSRRTAQIEHAAEERGITDPKQKDGLGAKTREKKDHTLSWNALRTEWNRRMKDKDRQAVAETHRRETPYAREVQGEGEAVAYAVDHCFSRESVVPERKLLTEALKRGIGSVTVEGVKSEMANRPLIRGKDNGREMVTTREVVNAELKLVVFARSSRGRFRPLGDPNRPIKRDWLNDEQKAAVRHALGSRDRVIIIRGVAGTGKTTLEQELGEALEEAGRHVVALAQSAGASRGVLREKAGFADADTVARFLVDKELQESARKGVILVDEASLLGTRDMLRVFDVAERIEARVVLVGDCQQHRSVSAGEPLKLLEERAGLPLAEVKEIMRQSGDYRKAAVALSEGRVEDGLAELDKLGWIKEVSDADRNKQLAAAYLAAVAEKKKNGEHKSALVVSPTHAEAARITQAIRNLLKENNKLGEEHTIDAWLPAHLTDAQKRDATSYEQGNLLKFHQNAPGHKNGSRVIVNGADNMPLKFADRFEVYRPARIALAAGDRVRITANGKTKDGHRLDNGSLYTLAGFNAKGDLVLDNGWIIARDWGHVAPGYVVTSHASQGMTVDRVFVSVSSQSFAATNARTAYVAATRGREQAVVFTDDKKELLRAFERPDTPMSATEFMKRRTKKMPLRQRLRKHLGAIRRLAYFSQAHPQRQLDQQRSPEMNREVDYAR